MLGLVVLLLTTIGSGTAALSILGHPGWLWQILAGVVVINALAAFAVVRRRAWGRRLALILLGAQVVGAVMALVVVTAVEVRDLPSLGGAISLIVVIFVPVVVVVIAVSLLAAWSIDRLAWPDR